MQHEFNQTLPAIVVANYFHARLTACGEKTEALKIIKLTYLTHGWHLGLTMRPLLREPILAWQHGPLIESLYNAYIRTGADNVYHLQKTLTTTGYHVAYVPSDHPALPFLDQVWESYGGWTSEQLSHHCRKEGTPWSAIKHTVSRSVEIPPVIPDMEIALYYQELGKPKPIQAQ